MSNIKKNHNYNTLTKLYILYFTVNSRVSLCKTYSLLKYKLNI